MKKPEKLSPKTNPSTNQSQPPDGLEHPETVGWNEISRQKSFLNPRVFIVLG
jgi:hypothetical protein